MSVFILHLFFDINTMTTEHKKNFREEETAPAFDAEPDSLRSSRSIPIEVPSTKGNFKEVMSRVARLVKEKTHVDIGFFPLSVAKMWIILFYVRIPEDVLSLLKDQPIRNDLKLRSADEKSLVDLSELPEKEDVTWLELNREGFDHLTNIPLKCPPFWSIQSRIADFQRAFQSSQFFIDFKDAFPESDTQAFGCSEETPHRLWGHLWENLIFLLRLYKTPAGSLNDVQMWKGMYNKKFVEAKATLLTKYPALPISVVFFVVNLMGENCTEILL